MNFYAVCNVNGPISVLLDGSTEAEAIEAFRALDEREVIDDARSDIENALDIEDADGMSEDEFHEALRSAGVTYVRTLNPIHNTHTGTTAHLADGWALWSLDVIELAEESIASRGARYKAACREMRCPSCDGEGRYRYPDDSRGYPIIASARCEDCEGSGWVKAG